MNELLYIDIVCVYMSVNQHFIDIYSKKQPFQYTLLDVVYEYLMRSYDMIIIYSVINH